MKSAVVHTEVTLHCGFRWLVSASWAQCTVGRKWLPAVDQREAWDSLQGGWGVVLAATRLSEMCRFANGCRGSCCLHIQCNSKLPTVTMNTAPSETFVPVRNPNGVVSWSSMCFFTCSLHLSDPFHVLFGFRVHHSFCHLMLYRFGKIVKQTLYRPGQHPRVPKG